MIKLLNKETKTTYVLSDETATKWMKESPEIWTPIEVGVQKGEPARKLDDETANNIIEQNKQNAEDIKKEDEPSEPSANCTKELNLQEMNIPELKALAQRLGLTLKGNPKKDTIINKIEEKLGK